MSASPKFDPNPLGPLGPLTTLSRIAPTRAAEPSPHASFTPCLAVVLVVVLFSGGLFGYDQGVISGALAGIKLTFALSPLIVEVVTSWITLGALFGALVGGELADSMGRKRTVLIAGVLFTLGAAVQAFAPATMVLVAGRLIIGAGVGVAAVAAPLYAAELAPGSWRGRFVSAYQLAIAIGIFLAYLVDGRLSANASWRMMLGAASVPGLLLFFVALVAPEISTLVDEDASSRGRGARNEKDRPCWRRRRNGS